MKQRPESRVTLEIKMFEEAERKLKASTVFRQTGAAGFDNRLAARSDPTLHPKDKVRKGKQFGRVTHVYIDYATVRWTNQTVTSEKISKLEKV